MKTKQLIKLGVPPGPLVKLAVRLIGPALHAGLTKADLRPKIKAVVDDPNHHLNDPHFGDLARAMVQRPEVSASYVERAEPATWRQWGVDLDPSSIEQMRNACRLPVSVLGALMPDAHVGYGLPIGGVLATENAVIPYAVGVDIACRMKLTVLDLPPKLLESQSERLVKAIETETRFGIGAKFSGKRRDQAVMDEDWRVTAVTSRLKDKAHAQLGTSGSGNHFVEFGHFTVDDEQCSALGLPDQRSGTYLALLTHSGSRGAGSTVASHYSRLAMKLHSELPKELRHLAWLDTDSAEGQEYWAAMQLMGQYAHANHDVIHRAIVRHLGARAILQIENHHNFAWKEMHRGKEVIVHRKGATPAGDGVLGIIPGSMASPCYVVRGKGEAESLNSAAHGAGRVMSRTKAKNTYRWSHVRDHLNQRGVKVLSAGIDEVPFVYKNIDTVMTQQQDLVEIVARFDPKLVKMAPGGDKPED